MPSKGFKPLPFTWRRAVMTLRGADLKVWLYHYWRTERDDETVTVTLPEIIAETHLNAETVKSSRARLVATGWLATLNPAQKDALGRWTVPTFRVCVPADAIHGGGKTRRRKTRPRSKADFPTTENPTSKETVLRGDAKVASRGKIVSESVSEGSESPTTLQDVWDRVPDETKSEVRTLAQVLSSRWEDGMYSILDVLAIWSLCLDTCSQAGMNTTTTAVAVAVKHLLAIYESDRWSGRKSRPAEKSVAALRRWLENDPHDPPDGKTLREQLRSALEGVIATARDRRDAATPKGIPTVCPDCGSRMEHGFCDACAFPEAEPEAEPQDRSEFLAVAKQMLGDVGTGA